MLGDGRVKDLSAFVTAGKCSKYFREPRLSLLLRFFKIIIHSLLDLLSTYVTVFYPRKC